MRSTRSKKSKKPVLVAVAAILVVAILSAGAFAWSDFTQSKTNIFRGDTEIDVTLHDEFDGQNKDVFVENSGDTDIYVRVRLDEFMQVGEKVFTMDGYSPNAKDKNTWIPHTYASGVDVADCGHTDTDKFHNYYTWTMGSEPRYYTPGSPGMVYTVLKDGEVDLAGDGVHQTAQSAFLAMSDFIALKTAVDANGGTAPAGEYKSSGITIEDLWTVVQNGCWLLDDTKAAAEGGGWAYWSQPLKPDTATGLLLDEVTRTSKQFGDNWIYRIDVKLQAVTSNDFAKWNSHDYFGYCTTIGTDALISMWEF